MTSSIEQPPTSGPGSGVAAWREYAAAVTGEPVAEFDDMTRDEVIEYLESSESESAPVDDKPATFGDTEVETPKPAPVTGSWMVPTDKGFVTEDEYNRRD